MSLPPVNPLKLLFKTCAQWLKYLPILLKTSLPFHKILLFSYSATKITNCYCNCITAYHPNTTVPPTNTVHSYPFKLNYQIANYSPHPLVHKKQSNSHFAHNSLIKHHISWYPDHKKRPPKSLPKMPWSPYCTWDNKGAHYYSIDQLTPIFCNYFLPTIYKP